MHTIPLVDITIYFGLRFQRYLDMLQATAWIFLRMCNQNTQVLIGLFCVLWSAMFVEVSLTFCRCVYYLIVFGKYFHRRGGGGTSQLLSRCCTATPLYSIYSMLANIALCATLSNSSKFLKTKCFETMSLFSLVFQVQLIFDKLFLTGLTAPQRNDIIVSVSDLK